MNLSSKELQDLKFAVETLENPGFAARLTHVIGLPFEKFIHLLPDRWSVVLQRTIRKALEGSLDFTISTMDVKGRRESRVMGHRFLSGMSGAIGGFFGTPALLLELPLSTIIILRSIAGIAISEGEDITRLQTKLACLEVFAIGGRSEADDDTELGYYAVRTMLAKTISEAAQHISEHGLQKKGAPILVKLILTISSRYGTVASQKFAAQLIPAIGAVGGAAVNVLFINHFQDMARGHFIVRRLERIYGKEPIRLEYERLRVEYEWSMLSTA